MPDAFLRQTLRTRRDTKCSNGSGSCIPAHSALDGYNFLAGKADSANNDTMARVFAIGTWLYW
jgi:hypothetical protein